MPTSVDLYQGHQFSPSDRSYLIRNRQQTERLKELRRLSDEELNRPAGGSWTVSAILAHIQYFDARGLGAIEVWRRHGIRLEMWIGAESVINDIRLPFWRDIPPREALEDAIRTAELLDDVLDSLTADEAETVARQRYRVLERALHRQEHLDDIDSALKG